MISYSNHTTCITLFHYGNFLCEKCWLFYLKLTFIFVFILILFIFILLHFYTFTFEVQTYPNFSLPFLKVILFLRKLRYFLKFWNVKRSCDQFCAKTEPKNEVFVAQAASKIFLIWLGNNFRFSKIMTWRNPEVILEENLCQKSNPWKRFVNEFNILIGKIESLKQLY